jgi:hypothetical protein
VINSRFENFPTPIFASWWLDVEFRLRHHRVSGLSDFLIQRARRVDARKELRAKPGIVAKAPFENESIHAKPDCRTTKVNRCHGGHPTENEQSSQRDVLPYRARTSNYRFNQSRSD